MSDDLTKHLKVTPEAHRKLSMAMLERYGTTSIRFSDAIEELAEEELDNHE